MTESPQSFDPKASRAAAESVPQDSHSRAVRKAEEMLTYSPLAMRQRAETVTTVMHKIMTRTLPGPH